MLVLPHANFKPKWVTQCLKLIHVGENQDPDFGDFPIQQPKTAENALTLTSHISAAALSWKASEPILERGYVGLQHM